MNADCILLVEDNGDDVILTQSALTEAGLSNPVHVVARAEEAVAYLSGSDIYADRTRFPLPKVVFVDLKLPGTSGHEVLKWIGGREELGHIFRVELNRFAESLRFF